MPDGQIWNFSQWITGSIWNGLKATDKITDCPLECWVSDSPRGDFLPDKVEYLFNIGLSVQGHGYEEPIWEEGNEPGVEILAGGGSIIGDWVLSLQLVENVSGRNEVLKEGVFSWNGTIRDIIVQRKWSNEARAYEPYFSGYKYPLIEWVKELFKDKPLDELLFYYERTPEKCYIEFKMKKVHAGEEIDIYINNITSEEDLESPHWQKIIAKVDKGKILNGIQWLDGYHIFPIGEEGFVQVKYKAPNDCDVTETISIYNTCDIGEHWQVNPGRIISTRIFPIKCEQFEIEVLIDVGSSLGLPLARAIVPFTVDCNDDQCVAVSKKAVIAYDHYLDYGSGNGFQAIVKGDLHLTGRYISGEEDQSPGKLVLILFLNATYESIMYFNNDPTRIALVHFPKFFCMNMPLIDGYEFAHGKKPYSFILHVKSKNNE